MGFQSLNRTRTLLHICSTTREYPTKHRLVTLNSPTRLSRVPRHPRSAILPISRLSTCSMASPLMIMSSNLLQRLTCANTPQALLLLSWTATSSQHKHLMGYCRPTPSSRPALVNWKSSTSCTEELSGSMNREVHPHLRLRWYPRT